ncbi:sigma 54-interacting transcriptional regulator [Archangium sp.]|uniref:sigma 54-interacting transcriptional regulator n=1 Tax=Archangium sp. TaxID=1872627 RepID=UPI002ED7B7F6
MIADFRADAAGNVDLRLMPWYVELSLTGLVESLADAQLFGVMEGAATGVTERPGVFERAAKAQEVGGEGALTGGVVFLDEIADLSLALQGKLLTVLSGGVFYRVGDEGNQSGRIFEGVTLTASWKPLDERVLRADLLSRIGGRIIRVPPLSEFPLEDFRAIVDRIQTDLLGRYKKRVDTIVKADRRVARGFWEERVKQLKPAESDVVTLLASQPWDKHGNVRGLTMALERILIAGETPDTVLRTLPVLGRNQPDANGLSLLVDRLAQRTNTGDGLAHHLRELAREDRGLLTRHLQENPQAFETVRNAIGLSADKLRTQLRQLERDRSHRDESE